MIEKVVWKEGEVIRSLKGEISYDGQWINIKTLSREIKLNVSSIIKIEQVKGEKYEKTKKDYDRFRSV